MLSKMLIAIDRNGLPDFAIQEISGRLCPSNTEILVLEVVEPILHAVPAKDMGNQPTASVEHQVHQNATRNLATAQKMFADAGFTVTARSVEGETKQAVLDVAHDWGADMIVVTSHGRNGSGEFFHRSVAEGLVHRAPCSVLVLKGPAAQHAG